MIPRLPPDNLILVIIGYLSETGKARINQRLSAERSIAAVADTMNNQKVDRLEGFKRFLCHVTQIV